MTPMNESVPDMPPVVGEREAAVVKPVEPSSATDEDILQSTHTINVQPATDDEATNISV